MKTELMEKINNTKTRSAWQTGVKQYAIDILELIGDQDTPYTDTDLLGGAMNWTDYSYGGCSLIYDSDIAARLCAPWELKRTKNGMRNQNSRESWLDVQTRALRQASYLIRHCYD